MPLKPSGTDGTIKLFHPLNIADCPLHAGSRGWHLPAITGTITVTASTTSAVAALYHGSRWSCNVRKGGGQQTERGRANGRGGEGGGRGVEIEQEKGSAAHKEQTSTRPQGGERDKDAETFSDIFYRQVERFLWLPRCFIRMKSNVLSDEACSYRFVRVMRLRGTTLR